MSLSVAPLTHKSRLSRLYCPSCLRETLHRTFLCLHCLTNHPPQKPTGPAYGARLVLSKPRR